MTSYRVTYPDGAGIVVPHRWMAENMRSRFGGVIDVIAGEVEDHEPDPIKARDDARDLAWDKYTDTYNVEKKRHDPTAEITP